MSLIKKLIILIIFIIFSFILFRLTTERRKLKTEFGIEGFREGALFSSPTADSELASLKNTDIPASTVDTINRTLPLKQYCIKGSYNSAITGNYVNIEMIKYLLYRGCRFLDFEIFSFDGEPYVAMSTDSTYSSVNTINKDSLQNIFSTIATYAFTAPSPINTDPLFINLRIKTKQTELYNKIGKIIVDNLGNYMYKDLSGNALPVNGDTILSTIRDKIIIVLDKTYAPTYSYKSNLGNNVNIISGGDTMRTYGYSTLTQQQFTSPVIKDDGINTDVVSLKLVYPDVGSNWLGLTRNALYYPMVLNYGVQIVLYPFYQVDMYLGQYEKAFSEKKAGIVPISQMILYLQSTLGGDSADMETDVTPPTTPGIDIFGAPPPITYESPTLSTGDIMSNVKGTLSQTTNFLFKGPSKMR